MGALLFQQRVRDFAAWSGLVRAARVVNEGIGSSSIPSRLACPRKGNRMDRPNRPDWRKQGRGSAPRREPAARERSSKWQERHVDAVQTAAFYHRLRMIALSFVALGLIVAFVVAVLFVPKQTPVISLTVWQYDATWPPNSYAAEDLRRLQAADLPNGNFQVLADEFRGSVAARAALDHLERRLSSVSPGGPGKDTVIV